MNDTFYCHACGKHKKIAVRVRPMQCASCNEKAKKYIANQDRRLKVSRHLGKQYTNERKLTETIKFLTKDD